MALRVFRVCQMKNDELSNETVTEYIKKKKKIKKFNSQSWNHTTGSNNSDVQLK